MIRRLNADRMHRDAAIVLPHVPLPGTLPTGGVRPGSGDGSTQKQPCRGASGKTGRFINIAVTPAGKDFPGRPLTEHCSWRENQEHCSGRENQEHCSWRENQEHCRGRENQEHCRGRENQEHCYKSDNPNSCFFIKEEDDLEEQSASQDVDDQDGRLIVDEMKEGQKEKYCLEESGQDEEERSFVLHSEDESQGRKGHGGPGLRKKRQERMTHGKQWILDNLLLVTATVSVVSLGDIEDAYRVACQEDGREPLSSNVLARLINEHFPQLGKYRQGSRGNQKIHYRNLQWRIPQDDLISSSANQDNLQDAPSSASENEAAIGVPSGNVTLLHDEDKKPVFSVSHRSIVQHPCPGKSTNEVLQAAKEAVARAATHPSLEGEDGDELGCEDAAKRLAQVVKWLKSEGKWDVLLKIFAHSASCTGTPCSPLCLMFRRVRRHVVSARHACYVLRLYSVLLKLHVASCTNNECGMTACPALRASRQMKRGREDELHEEEDQHLQQQEQLQHMTKKLNVRDSRPLSLKIRIPSPASSLPDSLPSTPSPPISPSHTLPPSPRRITPLCPMRVAGTPSESGGA
ncbi:hypothetical protein GWK47_025996 [Chionoecetes opilio]|uniref:RFX-type winged-helix domain-containing protein n=1 Tax=Chionoecetes opilio TaxID=41210 RepID=A0A8J8WAP9_CHIOP|nr:hypothetical protein GWK47_025996 [Chionoecetes opilio]